jgi:hypothetical protein
MARLGTLSCPPPALYLEVLAVNCRELFVACPPPPGARHETLLAGDFVWSPTLSIIVVFRSAPTRNLLRSALSQSRGAAAPPSDATLLSVVAFTALRTAALVIGRGRISP